MLKRVLPFMLSVIAGITLVSMMKAAPSFPSASATRLPQLEFSEQLPRLTRKEEEALNEYGISGLCHDYAEEIEVFDTFADEQPEIRARLLELPRPANWRQQRLCTLCFEAVRVTLTATGNVAEVVPVFTRSGHPNGTGLKPKELERFAAGCREGVLAAAKKIRFEPAMKDGQPVTQHVTIFYDSWGL